MIHLVVINSAVLEWRAMKRKRVSILMNAKRLECVEMIMNAVISMAALMAKSFTLQGRNAIQIQIVFTILNAIHF